MDGSTVVTVSRIMMMGRRNQMDCVHTVEAFAIARDALAMI